MAERRGMSYIRGMAEPNDPHDEQPADLSHPSTPPAPADDDAGLMDELPVVGDAAATDPASIAFPPPAQSPHTTPPATLVGSLPGWSPPGESAVPPTLMGTLSPATAEWLASRPAGAAAASGDEVSPAKDESAAPVVSDAPTLSDIPAFSDAAIDAELPTTDEEPLSTPAVEASTSSEMAEESADTGDAIEAAPAVDVDTTEADAIVSAAPAESALDPAAATPEPEAAAESEPFAIAPPGGATPPTLVIEPSPGATDGSAETIALDLPPGDVPIPLADAPGTGADTEAVATETEAVLAAPAAEQSASIDAPPATPVAAPVGEAGAADVDIPLAAVAVAGGVAAATHTAALPPALPTDAEVFAHAHDDVEHRKGFLSRGPITKLASFVGLVAVAAGLGVMLLACAGLTPIRSGLMLTLNPWLYGFAVAAGVIAVCQFAYAIFAKGRFGSAVVTMVVALAILGLIAANWFGGDYVDGMNPLFISQYIAMAGGGGAVLALFGGLLEHRRMREETHVLGALFVNVVAGLGGLLLWALYNGTKLM